MSADTSAVRAEEQLDLDALSAYLNREGFSGGRSISVEQFPGGHSNLTYLLKLDGAAEYVLRRPPLGPVAPKAHDMVREFRINLNRSSGTNGTMKKNTQNYHLIALRAFLKFLR